MRPSPPPSHLLEYPTLSGAFAGHAAQQGDPGSKGVEEEENQIDAQTWEAEIQKREERGKKREGRGKREIENERVI